MDRQAAYDLFKCFLDKRKVNIDLKKELSAILDYAKEKGFFTNPDDVFTFEAWGGLGDCLFRAVIDEDKLAKRFSRPWKAIINCLEAYKSEKRIAAVASMHLDGKPPAAEAVTCVFGGNNLPQAPTTTQVMIPPPVARSLPSAPPLSDELSPEDEETLEDEAARYHLDDNKTHVN